MTIRIEMRLVKKVNKRKLLAFTTYFLITAITILEIINLNLPAILEDVLISIFWTMLGVDIIIYILDSPSKISEKNEEGISKRIERIKKELIMFIPILLLRHTFCEILVNIVGDPANQIAIEQKFAELTLWSFASLVIVGPMVEEYIFRLLPSRFIKKKIPYIVISTVIFASMHIVNDPNPFCHIWFYMINPIYYGYRYYKTNDIFVSTSMHSLNNLISFIEMFL